MNKDKKTLFSPSGVDELQEQFRTELLATARCDRGKAEQAIIDIHQTFELAVPQYFFWYDSPPRAVLSASLLTFYGGMHVIEEGEPYVVRRSSQGDIIDAIRRTVRNQNSISLADQFMNAKVRISHISEDSLRPPRASERRQQCTAVQRSWEVATRVRGHIGPLMDLADNVRNCICMATDEEIRQRLRGSKTLDYLNWTWLEMIEQTRANAELHSGLNSALKFLMQDKNLVPGCVERLLDGFFPFMFVSRPDILRYLRYGQHESDRVASLVLVDASEKVLNCFESINQNCGWWIPFQSACIMIDRPVKMSIVSNFLHDDKDAACRYADGWEFFAQRGRVVQEWLAKGVFTAKQIDEAHNVEIKRLMVERYGASKYLQETGAVVIHSDKFGVLYSKPQLGDDPLVMVEVLNSTPEPDETIKSYFLRVPPEIRTAREAIAWTFGLSPDEYDPDEQT